MTIRGDINKQKKYCNLITIFGLLVIMFGIFIEQGKYFNPITFFLGGGILLVSSFISYFKVKCPKCKNKWGHMAIYSGGLFNISKKIKYCPFCAVDLDSDLKFKGV